MHTSLIFTTRALVLLMFFTAYGRTSAAGGAIPANKIEIAALLSTTGELLPFGSGSLEGVRFAVEEANESVTLPHIDLKVYDDESSPEAAKDAARRIVASPAVLVVGPSNTVTSQPAGEIFAGAGLPS